MTLEKITNEYNESGELVIHDGVQTHIACGDNTITFRVEDIRRERTGNHGKLSILLNHDRYPYPKGILSTTLCNFERDRERISICNQAFKFLGATEDAANEIMSKGEMLQQLMYFTEVAYKFYLSCNVPTEIEGTLDSGSIEYVAHPHVLRRGGTIMYGKPGKGKSFTGMLMAIAVESGANHYWNTTKGKTLFLNLERPDHTMAPRIGHIGKALGLNTMPVLATMNARSTPLVELLPSVESYIQKNEVTFVVIDSISRAGAGDMREDRVATATIDMLNSMGVAWLGIAHTPKYDEKTYYGNSQYEAGADVMVRHSSTVIDDKGSLAILLEVTKANDIPVPAPMGLHYSFDDSGLSGVRFATMSETLSLRDENDNHYISIKEFLSDNGKQTATQLSTQLSIDRKKVTNHLLNMYKSKVILIIGEKNNEAVYGLAQAPSVVDK